MSFRQAKFTSSVLSLLLAGPVGAQTVHRVVSVSPGAEISISLIEGDVTVRGWDRAEIEVSGELGGSTERLELTQDGERTLINVLPTADEVDPDSREDTEIYVSVPRETHLAVTTVNADSLIAGVHGPQSLHSVSGDIETELWSGAIEAETIGGDLSITGRGESGDAVLTTVSGEIEVRGPFGRLVASAVSGDIEVDVIGASLLQLETSNGDIDVHATLLTGAEVDAETTNGDVDLEIGEEGNLNLDVGTFSGRIESCFEYEVQRSSSGSGRSSSGSGRELAVSGTSDSPSIRVRTLNGDIELCSS